MKEFIQDIMLFFKEQTNVEKAMILYFSMLLVYVIFVLVLKSRQKRQGVFINKYKELLCNVTYIILFANMVISCTVYHIVENIIVYFGVMTLAAVATNYLCILGYSIRKYKDIEFAFAEDCSEVADYCRANDRVTEYMNEFVSYIGCIDEDEISGMDFTELGAYWSSHIYGFIKDRVQDMDYNILPSDKRVMYNFIKEVNHIEGIWHNDSSIKEFVALLYENKDAVLSSNIRIIPVNAKRFDCFIYVKGKSGINDFDAGFLMNTFKILSLL